MKKVFLSVLIFAGTIFCVRAQDIITKMDGSEIRAKVTEVDPNVVKYKLYDNQTGPTYVILKSELFRIKYENGRIEVFTGSTNSATGAPVNNLQQQQQQQRQQQRQQQQQQPQQQQPQQQQPQQQQPQQQHPQQRPPQQQQPQQQQPKQQQPQQQQPQQQQPQQQPPPQQQPQQQQPPQQPTPPPFTQTPVTAQPYQGQSTGYWKSDMQLKAPYLYQDYRKGSKLVKTGWWMIGGGFLLECIGFAVSEKEEINRTSTYIQYQLKGPGVALIVVGSLGVGAGTPIMIVGYVKKNRAKRDYLSQYGNRYVQKSPLQSPHFEIRTNGLAFVF
jgi:flagellar biosynthesis GTPase FlhF